MYVSRPVRAIRDDPIAGESIRLLVTLADDADAGSTAVEQAVRDTVATHSGTVIDERAFETLVVEVPHEAVASLCELSGLEAIETDDTLSLSLDGAGEDVDYGDE